MLDPLSEATNIRLIYSRSKDSNSAFKRTKCGRNLMATSPLSPNFNRDTSTTACRRKTVALGKGVGRSVIVTIGHELKHMFTKSFGPLLTKTKSLPLTSHCSLLTIELFIDHIVRFFSVFDVLFLLQIPHYFYCVFAVIVIVFWGGARVSERIVDEVDLDFKPYFLNCAACVIFVWCSKWQLNIY